MLKRLLSKRLEILVKNTEQIKQRINKYPRGYLKINIEKGGFYYYIVDKENGKRKYISKEDISQASLLSQRDYEHDYLKMAEKEINEINKLLSKNCLEKTKYCYSNLHAGRKCLVKPFEISDEEFINRWMSIPYTPKVFNESDVTKYYTEKGERVRSKSEVIIANMLNALNIPYKYECPLKLGDITIYPDFTILDVDERREKYLEHFGMMGDSDYVSNAMLKIATFEQNNIFLGERLICSFESTRKPLNIKLLRNKMKVLILKQ